MKHFTTQDIADELNILANYNPLQEFAYKLYNHGVTEQELQDIIWSHCRSVDEPTTLRVQNYLRDYIVAGQKR